MQAAQQLSCVINTATLGNNASLSRLYENLSAVKAQVGKTGGSADTEVQMVQQHF